MPPVILIYSLIGTPGEPNDYTAYSQDRFQSELSAAVAGGTGAVQVRLNSVGGNWLQAQGIVALIKASALKVDTYCDGIAASSASMIFMAGRKRLMRAHARLMIHNCSGQAAGQIDDLEKAIEGQKAINESMAVLYAAATSLPIEQIREMMAAETWLSAEQAVQLGFATGIIDAPKSATPPPADLTSSTAEASLLQLQAYYAGHLETASQTSTMKHLLLPILQANAVANPSLAGITAASTDEQVTAGVTAAFADLATTRTSLATATAQVNTLTETLATATAAATEATAGREAAEAELKTFKEKAAADEKAAGEKAITDLVASAVAAGKITAELAPHYTALATGNLASTTALLDKIPARKSLITTIEANATGAEGVGQLTAAAAMAVIDQKTKGN